MNIRLFCSAAILSLFAAFTVFGQESVKIKERMKSRRPRIVELKASGTIGENNGGLLEVRKENPEAAKIVAEENADRGKVYKAIAAKEGATPKVVGERRASRIAERAKTGEWIQQKDGNWIQK